MKRFLYSVFCFILCLFVSGCSNKNTNSADAEDISSAISYEIENLEGAQNFEEETIKTLAEFYRSNYSKNKNLLNFKNKHKSDRIYNIVKDTENDTPVIETKNIFIFDDKNDWSQEISKAEILKFLARKKINLASISNAKPVFENSVVKGIKIGETFISINEIVEIFNLPTAYIYNVEDQKTKLVVFGKYEENTVSINPETINNLAKDGKKRAEILNNLNNDFYLITKNK